MNETKLDFLTSRKFWSLLIMSVSTGLAATGYLDPHLLPAINGLTGGYIGLNILDKLLKFLNTPSTPDTTINPTPVPGTEYPLN